MEEKLRIIQTVSDDTQVAKCEKIEPIGSDTRRIFEDIRGSRLPFPTWETKSPFAGPLEVMLTRGDFHGHLIRIAPRTRSISDSLSSG